MDDVEDGRDWKDVRKGWEFKNIWEGENKVWNRKL